MMAGDKHRSSAKILLQASNVKSGSQHSTPFTKLIGIFKGDKDSWECVEAIFGHLIRSVQENWNRIKSLHLRCHQNFNYTHQSTESNSAHSSNPTNDCQSTSSFNPILDGGGGKFFPPAGFLNIAHKPLGLGS